MTLNTPNLKLIKNLLKLSGHVSFVKVVQTVNGAERTGWAFRAQFVQQNSLG